MNGAGGTYHLAHSLEASLDRFEVAPGRDQFFGEAHDEKIVERESVFTTAQLGRIDELSLDPVSDALRRDCKNACRCARREGLISCRLSHATPACIEYRKQMLRAQCAVRSFLTGCW